MPHVSDTAHSSGASQPEILVVEQQQQPALALCGTLLRGAAAVCLSRRADLQPRSSSLLDAAS